MSIRDTISDLPHHHKSIHTLLRMGIVSSVTDEEDDLPCGQHTMCSTNNMWTSDGSTQPNRKPESINFNQFFSGIHLTSIRHLVCFYHVTFVWSLNLFLLFFRLSSPVIYINSTNKLEWIWFLVFCWVSQFWPDQWWKRRVGKGNPQTTTGGSEARKSKISCDGVVWYQTKPGIFCDTRLLAHLPVARLEWRMVGSAMQLLEQLCWVQKTGRILSQYAQWLSRT